LSNEGIANRHVHTLDEREEAQVQRCQTLLSQPENIRAVTSFHWWPSDPSNGP
jgi:hypothetical protein